MALFLLILLLVALLAYSSQQSGGFRPRAFQVMAETAHAPILERKATLEAKVKATYSTKRTAEA